MVAAAGHDVVAVAGQVQRAGPRHAGGGRSGHRRLVTNRA